MDILVVVLIKATVFFLNLLPLGWRLTILHAVIRGISFFTPKLKQVAQINLQIAFPEKSASEHERIMRASEQSFARVLVDQLEMIENKTQGNLLTEEAEVLKNALANVRLAFVETAKGISSSTSPPPASTPAPTSSETKISTPPPSQSSEKDNDEDEENKKRFTKKYG